MRPASKNALLLTVLLAAVAMMVWPGCATVPLPASREPIAGRKPNDFGFIRPGRTTRSDVMAKLGSPDWDYPDLRVVGYHIAKLQPTEVSVVFGVPSISRWHANVLELDFIEFDEQDRVKRSRVATTRQSFVTAHPAERNPSGKSGRQLALDWLAGKLK